MKNNGFTLIELLVALAIFAIVSVIAYGGLRTVIEAKGNTERYSEELATMQRALAIIGRDIEQAIARTSRDEFGDAQPPVLGQGDFGTLLELTRSGWRNPAQRRRSAMQRVAYLVRDDELVRLNWAMLDRAPDSPPQATVLLPRINSIEVRFMDANLQSHDYWPANWPISPGQELMPTAIEVVLDIGNWGEISRLYRVVNAS